VAAQLGEFAAQSLARTLAQSEHRRLTCLDLSGNNAIRAVWLMEGPPVEDELHHGVPTIATSLAAAFQLAQAVAAGGSPPTPRCSLSVAEVVRAVGEADQCARYTGGLLCARPRHRSQGCSPVQLCVVLYQVHEGLVLYLNGLLSKLAGRLLAHLT
jgi:hypothetical protein